MSFPDSLSVVTITGTFYDGDGDLRPGVATVTLLQTIRSEGDNAFVPVFVGEQDFTGTLAIDVPSSVNDEWVPDTEYLVQVTFTDDFVKLWWRFPVPQDAGAIDLADVGDPTSGPIPGLPAGTPSQTTPHDGGYRGAYVPTTLYKVGDTVNYAGKNWGALKPSAGVTPGSSGTTWEEYPQLSVLEGLPLVSSVNGQTGVVTITDEQLLPTMTGQNGKFLSTDGSQSVWAVPPSPPPAAGDMLKAVYDPDDDGIVLTANQLRSKVYFQGAANKGDPVYVSGVNGSQLMVNKSQGNNPTTLPAFAVAYANTSGGQTGDVVTYGTLGGLNTNAFALRDIIYVAPTGGITNVRPATNPQAMGVCLRSGGSDGVIGVVPQQPNVALKSDL